MVFYCCVEEQRQDWKVAHKVACLSLQQANTDEEARFRIGWLVENVDTTLWTKPVAEVPDWPAYFAMRPLFADLLSGGGSLAHIPDASEQDQIGASTLRFKTDELSYALTIGQAIHKCGVPMNKTSNSESTDEASQTTSGSSRSARSSGKKGRKATAAGTSSPRPKAPSKSGVTHIDLVGCSNTFAESSKEIQEIVSLVISLCAMFPDRGELHVRVIGPSLSGDIPSHVCIYSITCVHTFCI